MATVNEAFSSLQTYSFAGSTLNSLANNGAWQTTKQDNHTNLYLDALVTIKIKTGGSGVVSTGSVAVYAYGSLDNSIFPDTVTGTEGTLTLVSPTNLRQIGLINAVAVSTSYIGEPISLATAFNGTLPPYWGLVLVNNTGGTLDATIGNFSITWLGVTATVV